MSRTDRAPVDPQAILRAAEAAARTKGIRQPATGPAPSKAAGAAGSGARREGTVTAIGDDVDPDVRKALAFVLRSTGARPQTEAEIAAKLDARGVDATTARAAMALARDLRALDDRAFAESWVAERGLRRGYGATRLRADLRRRLVPEALIDEALTALEPRDDLTAAADIARARMRQLPASLPAETVVRRLTSYLVRRGHPPALAQRVAITVSGIDREWD